MNNFRIIRSAIQSAKTGAALRVSMGGSTGDNAFADCVADQVDDLCDQVGCGIADAKNAVWNDDDTWAHHCALFNRFRGAFWRAIG
jgi:hypothetical protein|tara:strand:+ start:12397 stop:12654 length:258 start_codon:yes stop_codon:yes gene_type:complete